MSVEFKEVFAEELEAVNFRRRLVQDGTVARERAEAAARLAAESGTAAPASKPQRAAYAVTRVDAELDQESAGAKGTTPTTPGSDLSGVSLSGGGIRSASFSLGVLQALDSLADRDQPQVIDAIDYLSTVSGGGYIGTSLVAGLMDGDHSFPFTSKLDEEETPEVQHLRDFSNFLAPNGTFDLVIGFAFVLRGLLVNAVIVFPWLLLLAAMTLIWNPTVGSLTQADVFGWPVDSVYLIRIPGFEQFTLTLNIAIFAGIVMFASAFIFRKGGLTFRERLGVCLAWLVVIVVVVGFFEAQPYVLSQMVDHALRVSSGDPNQDAETLAGDGWIAEILKFLGSTFPIFSTALAPLVLLLVSVGQKLANVAKAAVGDNLGWQDKLAKYTSKAMLYFAGLLVPLILWITYLYLCLWAIQAPPLPASPDSPSPCGRFTPSLLQDLTQCAHYPSWAPAHGHPIVAVYFAAWLILTIGCLFIGPNVNSLHRYYRDRLSRAFLIERKGNNKNPARRNARSVVDTKTFASLKPRQGSTFKTEAAYSPYLLVNAAINLEASEKLNRRGRNADTFIFSPLFVGSTCTGYSDSEAMRDQVKDLGLGTAMAISGAAASANMGRMTIKVLTFSLALLNIRLGYWLANPFRLGEFKSKFTGWLSNIGTVFFAKEALGQLDEQGLNVYLTDGGHVENLGIYELIRRRCKVIIGVDVDLDPGLNFPSLVGLEMMTRIDLGARIEVPWLALQKSAVAVTEQALHGADADDPFPHGPHAAIGAIRYENNETGVLILIKTSLSGDENDYILDYKRRNPDFPHETTLDQFFTEEQFEVYRALGFHAARQLFTGADKFGQLSDPPPGWSETVANALALLNIPEDMINSIVGCIKDPGPPPPCGQPRPADGAVAPAADDAAPAAPVAAAPAPAVDAALPPSPAAPADAAAPAPEAPPVAAALSAVPASDTPPPGPAAPAAPADVAASTPAAAARPAPTTTPAVLPTRRKRSPKPPTN